jgi:hypothetical protein
MDDKFIAALIAGTISLVGVGVNIYLNAKSSRHALEKIRLEFKLEKEKRVSERFGTFASRVAEIKYSLNHILIELKKSTDRESRRLAIEQTKKSFEDLMEIWRNMTYEMFDLKMEQSSKIGAYMNNSIGALSSTIIFHVNRFYNVNRFDEEEIVMMEDLIIKYQRELDRLIEMIIKEKKLISAKFY